ncbi:MAG: sulfatase [Myxococcota bacterium]|jgi:arylsulfatase A-like enzyme|nr:sulfatase [Myxococcota bacterium]
MALLLGVLTTLFSASCTSNIPPHTESSVEKVSVEAPASDGGMDTVVLVVGCTLRATRMHVYGHKRANTPYLDQLAGQGVRFTRMLSNASWTRPALTALFTGQLPLRWGIDHPGKAIHTPRALHSDALTLAERFAAQGWSTVGVTGNANANADFGMAQGFQDYQETTEANPEEFTRTSGSQLVDQLLEQISHVKGPVFAQVVLIDTHAPLPDFPRRLQRLGLSTDKAEVPRLQRYDAAVLAVDDAIRRLDEGLTKLGRSDRLLTLVGDHGEGLLWPTHHGFGHGHQVYDGNLHVPWIVHGPGVAWGRSIDGLAQSVDLTPTLVDLAGLASDQAGESPVLDGRSLAAQVRGELNETRTSRVFSETLYGAEHRSRLTTPQWAFIRNFRNQESAPRGERELYADKDRLQHDNLVIQQPVVADRLEQEIDALRSLLREDQRIYETTVGADVTQALEALGYVER